MPEEAIQEYGIRMAKNCLIVMIPAVFALVVREGQFTIKSRKSSEQFDLLLLIECDVGEFRLSGPHRLQTRQHLGSAGYR